MQVHKFFNHKVHRDGSGTPISKELLCVLCVCFVDSVVKFSDKNRGNAYVQA